MSRIDDIKARRESVDPNWPFRVIVQGHVDREDEVLRAKAFFEHAADDVAWLLAEVAKARSAELEAGAMFLAERDWALRWKKLAREYRAVIGSRGSMHRVLTRARNLARRGRVCGDE